MKIESDNNLRGSSSASARSDLNALLKPLGLGLLQIEKMSINSELELVVRLAGNNSPLTLRFSQLPSELIEQLLTRLQSLSLSQSGQNLKVSLSLSSDLKQSPNPLSSNQVDRRISNSGTLTAQSMNTKTLDLVFKTDASVKERAITLHKVVNSETLSNWIRSTKPQTENSSQTTNRSSRPTQPSNEKLIKLVNDYIKRNMDAPPKLADSLPQITRQVEKLLNGYFTGVTSVQKSAEKTLLSQLSKVDLSNLIQLPTNAKILESNAQKHKNINLLNELSSALKEVLQPSDKQKSVSVRHRVETSGNHSENQLQQLERRLSTVKDSQQNNVNLNLSRRDTNSNSVHSHLTPDSSFNEKVTAQSSSKTIESQPVDLKSILIGMNQLGRQLLLDAATTKSGLPASSEIVKALAETIIPLITAKLDAPIAASPKEHPSLTTIIAQALGELTVARELTLQQANQAQITNLSQILSNYLSSFSSLSAGFKALSQISVSVMSKQAQIKILEQLIRNTESAIQRVEYNQLLTARAELSGSPLYLVELPIMHLGKLDSFELLFDRSDHNEPRDKRKIWKVTVRFDLPPLGPMFARVTFNNGELTTDFYAKEESTADLIEEHLEKLNQSLFSAGIKVNSLTGQKGVVPEVLVENRGEGISLLV